MLSQLSWHQRCRLPRAAALAQLGGLRGEPADIASDAICDVLDRRFYSLGSAGSGGGRRSLVYLAVVARPGRVVHGEVEPAVRPRGVSALRFPAALTGSRRG